MSTAEELAREFAAMNKAYERNHALLAELRDERKLIRQDRDEIKAIVSEIKKVFDESANELINARLDRILPAVQKITDEKIEEIKSLIVAWQGILTGAESEVIGMLTTRIVAAAIEKMTGVIKDGFHR